MTGEQQDQKAPAAAAVVDVAVEKKPVEVEIPADAGTPAGTLPTSTTPTSGTSLGGRVRKTTQKFTFVENKGDEAEEFVPPVGKGTKVRDITFVGDKLAELGKKQTEMIKQLYSVMYGRRFQQKNLRVIKEHIMEFSGICEQDDKSREHLEAKMGKWKRIFVQEVMDLLAVDRSKKSFDEQGKQFSKEALIERLIEWLYNPQETQIGEKKAKAEAKAEAKLARKRAKRAKAKTEKAKTAAQPAKKKRKTTKKAAAEDEEEEEEEHEATESEAEESSSDFDEAQKATKKRRKGARQTKKSRIIESDQEEDDEKVEDEDEEAEEQPAAEPETAEATSETQKAKPATTLAPEVCEKVRDIIAHGNAEELTVKKIVRQLSEDMGRDMTSQKKAIKAFITEDQM